MRQKSSAPAPRTARKPRETAEQKKARVFQRSRELILIAKRGDTPEEIIEKGKALQELKRLRPWKHHQVAGKNLSFESLLEIARAPAERHQEMIVAAEGGIRGRALRRMAQGEEGRGPAPPYAAAADGRGRGRAAAAAGRAGAKNGSDRIQF